MNCALPDSARRYLRLTAEKRDCARVCSPLKPVRDCSLDFASLLFRLSFGECAATFQFSDMPLPQILRRSSSRSSLSEYPLRCGGGSFEVMIFTCLPQSDVARRSRSSEVIDLQRIRHIAALALARRGSVLAAHRCLRFAYRKISLHDLLHERSPCGSYRSAQEASPVSRRKLARLYHVENLVGKIEQTHRVRHRRAGFCRADAPRPPASFRRERISSAYAIASSMGFKSSRCMFSISATCAAFSSSASITITGTSVSPASFDALQRRSPAMISESVAALPHKKGLEHTVRRDRIRKLRERFGIEIALG